MAARLTKPIHAATHLRSSTERTPIPDPPGLELAVELAHDIRSPLGALVTLAELLQSGACGPTTDAQARHLKQIETAARGLARLTEDIVESGRAGALDVRTPPAAFSIDALLDSVREIAQPMADASHLELVVHNYAPPQWMGRRSAIGRVLMNLVTNAIKYTERGVVELGARIIAVNRVEFFVRDTGNGLAARGTGRNDTGAAGDRWRNTSTGLGLAICRRLLYAMGVSLDVESRPGEGSRFSFVIELPEQS